MTDRILQHFIGDWTLERRIHHDGGAQAGFQGHASWRAQPGGALYTERGSLEMNGQAFDAERRYVWDDALRVFFDDGRFFHRVPPTGGTAAHWCDPDQYEVRYDFANWPDWEAVWRVRGPRKDYVMTTRYRSA